jgi:hypothetical protein
VTVDTTPPVVSITVSPLANNNTVNSAIAGSTTSISGTVSGEYHVGDTVTTTINGHAYTTTLQTGGIFTFANVAGADLASATSITASLTTADTAGNTATVTGSKAYAVDTTTITPTISTSSSQTNNSTPTISGSAEAGSSVQIYNGATLIATVTADATTGAYSYTPTTSLSDGTYTLSAKATDSAGNVSSASSVATLKIDTISTTPTIGTIASTSNDKPTITGTAEAGATVTIMYGATTLGTVTADSSGTGHSLLQTISQGQACQWEATVSASQRQTQLATRALSHQLR